MIFQVYVQACKIKETINKLRMFYELCLTKFDRKKMVTFCFITIGIIYLIQCGPNTEIFLFFVKGNIKFLAEQNRRDA